MSSRARLSTLALLAAASCSHDPAATGGTDLLWVGGHHTGQVITTPVETRQLARSVLESLQLDPGQLEAQASEPVDALPGL